MSKELDSIRKEWQMRVDQQQSESSEQSSQQENQPRLGGGIGGVLLRPMLNSLTAIEEPEDSVLDESGSLQISSEDYEESNDFTSD